MMMQTTRRILGQKTVSVAVKSQLSAVQTVGSIRCFAVSKKKAAAKKKEGKRGGEDTNFEALLRVLRGRYPEAEPFTAEEKERHAEIARRYGKMSVVRHNHYMRDLQTKIDMKWEAINALPAELQAEALEVDDEPWPEERGFATWTPPIEGFQRYTGEAELEQ